jgi:3-deoxy-D-manno-octulosonic-acid transferase
MGLYGIADVVFVGKSLCAHGSQNMIEPCLCGKPVFVGPYTENFRPVMSDLLSANALIQVADAAELAEFFKATFASPDADAEMSRRVSGIGERAALAVARRRGACGNCAADILSRIS